MAPSFPPPRAAFPPLRLPRVLRHALPLACAAGLAFAQSPALAQTPARVGVVAAQDREVTRAADFVGRAEAIGKVDIRARVKGYLKSVNFKDGQAVKVGDPLYEIEPDLFKADVASAEGALARAEASKVLSALQLKRAQELLTKQAGTAVQRDQAAAADQESAGAILTARANLDTARINLGYTTITSPIDGRIGKTNVTDRQCRRSRQRHARHRGQRGPDLRQLPGQPARILARRAATPRSTSRPLARPSPFPTARPMTRRAASISSM